MSDRITEAREALAEWETATQSYDLILAAEKCVRALRALIDSPTEAARAAR